MASTSTQKRIVVVGCGVAGLTTALLLSQNADCQITVAAKHMPGDYDIEYASPWAGANYLPVSAPNTPAASHDANTWPEFERLARCHPEAGIHFQKAVRYNRAVDIEKAAHNKGTRSAESLQADSWFKNIVPNFRPLHPSELPPGYTTGTTFTSICLDPSIYLPYLKSRCLASGNVTFARATFTHIAHATHAHHSRLPAHLIVNCTGLSSRFLGGVRDLTLYPARGQTVLVRNTTTGAAAAAAADDDDDGGDGDGDGLMCDTSGTDDGNGDDEVSYVMQRAGGGGTLLGGSYQKGNWDGGVDPNLAVRIMRRAVEICPGLVAGGGGASTSSSSSSSSEGKKGIEGLDIVRFGVGLRPVREAGVRLEKEKMRVPARRDGEGQGESSVWVVHNYGHGGYGYQSSYGCAGVAVGLVEEALREQQAGRAKL